MEFQDFDEAYVARLARGDTTTEEHFTAYFRELLRLKLRSRLRSSQLIEDTIQETFLRVFATLRRDNGLDHAERLGAFVNAVCNNVAREFLRSEGRAAPMPETAEPMAADPSVESRLLSRERQQLVGRVMRDLPAKDLGLLRQVFLEERDKDEVCAEYGVDREYLRVLLHRAVVKARVLLRAQYSAARA